MRKNIIMGAIVLGVGGAMLGGACASDDTPKAALDLRHMDKHTAESLIGQRMGTERETLEAHLRAFLVMNSLSEFQVDIEEFRPISEDDDRDELAGLVVGTVEAMVESGGVRTLIHGQDGPGKAKIAETIYGEDAPNASHFARIRWIHGEQSWVVHALLYPKARVGNPWEIIEWVTGTAIGVNVLEEEYGLFSTLDSSGGSFVKWHVSPRFRGSEQQPGARHYKKMQKPEGTGGSGGGDNNDNNNEKNSKCPVTAGCDEGKLDCGPDDGWEFHIGACYIKVDVTMVRQYSQCGGTCNKACVFQWECGWIGYTVPSHDDDTTDDCCSQ